MILEVSSQRDSLELLSMFPLRSPAPWQPALLVAQNPVLREMPEAPQDFTEARTLPKRTENTGIWKAIQMNRVGLKGVSNF